MTTQSAPRIVIWLQSSMFYDVDDIPMEDDSDETGGRCWYIPALPLDESLWAEFNDETVDEVNTDERHWIMLDRKATKAEFEQAIRDYLGV